jgi:SpoIID/LytB domain protein
MRRSHLLRRRLSPSLAAFVLIVAAVVAVSLPASRSSAEVIDPTTSGTWTVAGHGLGHGHGMSQYGARGAAIRGLTATQIIGFYYPGTTLSTLSQPTIRVLITSDGGTTTVAVPAGQTIALHWSAGIMNITSATASQVRLIAAPSGRLQAQYYKTAWVNWGGVLPASADLSSSVGYLHLYQPGGSTDYRGTIGAVNAPGVGRITINRLPLDAYTDGVVPREMPSSWQAAAVQAQAIAARSYARYAVEHNASSSYDICDTTNCQVYGGKAHYNSAGALLYGEDAASNAAVTATANRVASYGGSTIFAQFSASNGGWTVDGGQPYLVAKADPYEQYSGDPYLNWSQSVAISSVAAYYGLSRISQITIDSRDGHGEWGGRVLTATVSGVRSSGAAAAIATTGFELQNAMRLPHNWFHVQSTPPTAPATASAAPADGAGLISWTPPTSSGSDTISGYSVTVAGVQRTIAAAGDRSAWIGGLHNGAAYTALVRAINSAGEGAATSVTFTPAAAPAEVAPVTPLRIFDSRNGHVPTTEKNPLIFGIGGHGTIPGGAATTAVQLAVTIVAPSASGVLRAYTDGSPMAPTASIAYTAGQTSTTTVSIPMVTSGRVTFRPSAGSMYLVADQLGYSRSGNERIVALAPVLVADMPTITTGAGRVLGLRGQAGVPTDASAVVLQISARNAHASYVKAWPDGTAAPVVSQLSIPPGGRSVNTVTVPLGADGAVRFAASIAGTSGQISVVGYLAPAATGRGHLETPPPTPIADSAAHVGADIAVSRTTTVFGFAGRPQIPSSGVSAVLVQVTASAVSATGWLWMYADGAAAPRGKTAALVVGVNTTTTVLVPVSAAGSLRLVTDGPTARVAIDLLGYVTTS